MEALLIVLMAGTEIFRPLRDLRSVLHQGMVGQSAAVGINALLETEAAMPSGIAARPASLAPTIEFSGGNSPSIASAVSPVVGRGCPGTKLSGERPSQSRNCRTQLPSSDFLLGMPVSVEGLIGRIRRRRARIIGQVLGSLLAVAAIAVAVPISLSGQSTPPIARPTYPAHVARQRIPEEILAHVGERV